MKLEEHYVIIGEPGEFYLSHTTPKSGKGIDIAASIHKEIKDTPLEDNLRISGSDGTSIMTGEYNGAIRKHEELLGRLLQWCICLFHSVELPLKHVCLLVDGTSTAPDSFSGPIGKRLRGKVSDWGIAKFRPMKNPNFPSVPNAVLENLSTDQSLLVRDIR